MVMPASQKLRLLEGAALVVHVEIERVDALEIAPGKLADCVVTGRVRRVFSGDCPQDCELSFTVTAFSENPPPGDCYQDLAKLRSARFIEAYLDRDADQPGGWRAIETSLPQQLGDEPGYLVGLRQSVASVQAAQEQTEPRRSGLFSFVGRLFGRN